MAHERGDIDRWPGSIESGEEVAERPPLPVERRPEPTPCQPRCLGESRVGRERRGREPAVADHLRGDSLCQRIERTGVGRQRVIRVRVHVDEARGDHQVAGVDDSLCRLVGGALADGDDAPAIDRDVGPTAVAPTPIQDRPGPDPQIVHPTIVPQPNRLVLRFVNPLTIMRTVRLIRVGTPGQERPHLLLDDDRVLDVTDDVGDFDPSFFSGDGLARLATLARDRAADAIPRPDGRLGSPVARPGKIVCIGLNYADHAAESGAPIPTEPIVFFKATNTLIGPDDDVHIPRTSTKTDWEVELGVVIGRPCRYLETHEEALAAVAGYMVSHDVSERAFQLERGGQWVKGKSCETFNPAGPWLLTADTGVDPDDLDLWLDVNGQRRQTGSTKTMIFGVAEIIRYLSQFMVLDPGDIINTGTPPGVAMGTPGQPYLRAGDVVELGVAGLGRQRQRFIDAP